MYQIIRTYTKTDGSELYDDVMGMIGSASANKAFKEEKEGFVGLRGYLSPDGTQFIVKESWDTYDNWSTWFNSDPDRRLASRAVINQYLTDHNINESVERVTLP